MKIKKYLALYLITMTIAVLATCAEEFESPEPLSGSTLTEVAAADTTLEIFTAAMVKTGIGISLGNITSGQHTVFAPTDSAFRVYFKASGPAPASNYNTDAGCIAYINTMSSSSAITLTTFINRLQYHIVSSKALAADITNSKVFTPIVGNARLSLSKSGSTILINGNIGTAGGKVRVADIEGANGVIHTVNKFLTAISTANIYANTNGLGITLDYTKSPILVTIGATLGGNYDLFANAVKKTGLATTLRPNVPPVNLPDYTVFAPSDAALQAYLATKSGSVVDEPSALTYLNSLTGSDSTAFANLIRYHVALGRVLSTDLVLGQNISTLATGETLEVSQVTPSFTLDGTTSGTANVTTNVIISNAGILHRLDAVLIP